MVPSLSELGIDRLSIDDRIGLAHAIWESIAAEADRPFLSDDLRAELRRRVADHEANPGDVVPWEQIEADAMARFRKRPVGNGVS